VDLAATAGAHAAYKVAGLAILVVLTRTLAKDSLGLFLFASSLVALVSPLAELGLNTLLVRDVAVAPEHAAARLRRVLRLRAGLLALAAAALTAGTAIVRPPLTGVIALLAVGGAFDELAMTFGAYFVGLRRARINAVLGVGGKALLVALVAAAALWTRELTIVLVAVAAANAARLAASMIVAQRIGFRWRGAATDEIHRPPAALGHEVRGDARSPVEGTAAVRLPGAREAGIPSPSDETPRALVHRALPLFALGALASVHLRGDAALLGWLASYTAVATYGATFRLLEAAQFVTRPLGVVFLPLFASRMAAGERAWVGAQFRRLLALAVGAGIAGAALVFVAAGWFVPLLFGASYADCVPVMRILYLALPGFLTIVVCGTAVRALKREREAIVISVACAAVGFVAKAIAIPAAGVIGVAWCTVAMFTLQGLLLARCVRAAIAESPIGAEAAAAATPTSNQPAATNPVDAQALAADPEARVAI
jgi:O-antigen/teichoic acid export membrane protein